jgi:hypothetical protein
MKKFYTYITNLCLFCLLIVGQTTITAQTTSNPDGFEDGTIVDWQGNTTSETATINSTIVRTGSYSLKLTTTSSFTNRNWYSHYPYGASASGTYVHFIYWAKAASGTPSVNASLRYDNEAPPVGAGSLVAGTAVALNTSTWVRVRYAAGNTNGRWYFPAPRKTTSGAGTFYLDDMIIYTSSSSTTDITAPSAATGATGNNVSGLSWTNGSDSGTGSTNVQNTLIFKRTAGTVGTGGLTLNDQAIYSLIITNGPTSVGNWTLITDTIAASSTSYSEGSFTVGEEYAIVHRDLAYNYSTPTYIEIQASTLAGLTTEATTTITLNSALGNGTITYLGNGITTSGVCWNETGNPDIVSDSYTTDGPSVLGAFSSGISGLNPNTLYHIRAYATTLGGTSYGNDVSFVTLPNPPTVGSATDTTSTGFLAHWSAPTAMGTAPYTYHLQVSKTSGNYTVLAADISNIASTDLAKIVSGLDPTTDYYYRVRAENESGESDWSAESVKITTLTQSSLTVNCSPVGSGTVTVNDTIPMTDGVAVNFTTGQLVTLKATPASGYGFVRWVYGLQRNNDNPFNISVSENKTVTALFGPVDCTNYNLEDVLSTELSNFDYVTVSFTSGGKTWNTIDGRLNTTMAQSHSTPQSIQLFYMNSAIITPIAIKPTSLSFWTKMYTSGYSSTINVYASVDGGLTYGGTPIYTGTVVNTNWQQITIDSVFTSTNVRFKIINNGAGSNCSVMVDDIQICESPDGIPPSLTFNPANAQTGVALAANLTITSDERLFRYIPSTGAFSQLQVGDPAFSNADTLATFLTLKRVSDDVNIPFTVDIDASGKVITINPDTDFDYYTNYKISITNIADSCQNILSSTQYAQFTSTIPPSPIISIKEVASNKNIPNGGTFNVGTFYNNTTVTKTFRLSNIGVDPLNISSCTLSGGGHFNLVLDPAASVIENGSTDFMVSFTSGTTKGVFRDTLTIISNDIVNATYVIYLSGMTADFVLPYTYQSGCTDPVMTSSEMTHDYTSLSDIPSAITRKNGVPLSAANFYQSYTVFQGEGNCMPSGSSVIKVGRDTRGLQIALPNCGEVTVKWCSNGYRKIKISDSNDNLYELSPSYLPSNICYTTHTVVNDPNPLTLNIELIGNDSALLTTVYYLQITPYNPAILSSGRNITEFTTGLNGEKVRIYDDVILISVPDSIDLSAITPTTITTSPFASVAPLAGVTRDFSSGALTYTVTAQDGQTKNYSVRIEHGINYGGLLYKDSISITLPMDSTNKTIELIEVTNSSCEVPISGNGSDYTIFFLDASDKPLEGYKIVGPSKICIGTVAEYKISNPVETNNPIYNWSIGGTAKDLFTIIGDTISDVLRLKAPNEMVEGTIDFSIVVEFDPSQCVFLRGEDDISVGVTDQSPEPITGITSGCAYNGLLEVTAIGSTDATSYNWEFNPFTTVVSQDDNSIVLNVGSDNNDITAQINTQNGCGITINENEYDIPYAKEWTKWNGSSDNDWDRNSNWSDRVPKACTDVVIPDVGSGVAYPIIGDSGECHYITFEPGGAVLGLHKLEYVRAYIQLETQREKWYTLTAPLKNMYSADYAYQGMPVTKMRLFDNINPDSLSLGGVMNTGTWTRAFSNGEVNLTPGMGFAFYLEPKTYNFPNPITFEYGNKIHYFPRENTPDNLMILQYNFSTYSGRLLTDYTINLPRDTAIAYRFAMENNNNQLVDKKVRIKPGLNLIGNPLMTHLDFNEFYTTNSSKISNKVKFWNGTTFTTYMSGDDIKSSMDLTYTSIPPMQAFFVEGLNTLAAFDSISFDLDQHFVADLTTKLRGASVSPNTLYIETNNGTKKSSTVITMRDNTSNSFGDDDAFKLFTQYTNVPDVYTTADEIPLDINQFSTLPYMVPVGINTTSIGNITFTFTGAESFNDVEVSLLNTRTGEQQNLKENPIYQLNYDGSNPDGYLFIEFRSATTTTETPNNPIEVCTKCIQVYQKDSKTIGIVSPITDKIDNITVWEQSGKMLYNKTHINNTTHDITVAPHQACVVRVATQTSTYVVKLLMK